MSSFNRGNDDEEPDVVIDGKPVKKKPVVIKIKRPEEQLQDV